MSSSPRNPIAPALWQRRELRFLAVGGWNTIFGYLVFVALYAMLESLAHYLAIAIAAHFIAVAQSFATQRRLVFRSTANWLSEYVRFNVASLIALGFNLVLLHLLVERGALNVLGGQAIATILTVALSYLLHLRFSFRAR